jgi:hypothetical protein
MYVFFVCSLSSSIVTKTDDKLSQNDSQVSLMIITLSNCKKFRFGLDNSLYLLFNNYYSIIDK